MLICLGKVFILARWPKKVCSFSFISLIRSRRVALFCWSVAEINVCDYLLCFDTFLVFGNYHFFLIMKPLKKLCRTGF